jgi:hypothetical protein
MEAKGLPWPERVPAHFKDGPLKDRDDLVAPARGGVPAMAVCVRPDTEPPELVAANEVEPGCTWLRYLSMGDRGKRPGDPWPFIYWER